MTGERIALSMGALGTMALWGIMNNPIISVRSETETPEDARATRSSIDMALGLSFLWSLVLMATFGGSLIFMVAFGVAFALWLWYEWEIQKLGF